MQRCCGSMKHPVTSRQIETGRQTTIVCGQPPACIFKGHLYKAAVFFKSVEARPLITNILPVPFSQRSEEHTSELQSLMRNSYAVFCLKQKTNARKTKKY